MPPQYFADAKAAALEEVLGAREQRATLQRRLLKEYAAPLICFTLNIPGEYKMYPLARQTFREGCGCIDAQLELGGMTVLHREERTPHTGCEAYYIVKGEASAAKALLVSVEEGHPLGRLFDMDVLDVDGSALRGADLGREERSCFVCDRPVWECSRNRTHSAEELALHTARLMEEYFRREYADTVARAAQCALLYEVNITPKPGLVDRANNGSHRDMDIFTFIDSGCALGPYFRDITLRGLRFDGEAKDMLPTLRYCGQRAEARMLAVTRGVNTHKGLVFSMGLLCAAMGYLHSHGLAETPEALLGLCAQIAGNVPGELADGGEPVTHGRRAFARYGVTGIRGEAAAGFPSVAEHGYPVLRRLIKQGCSVNDAGVVALLHLMTRVDDTNLLNRGGGEVLRRVKEEISGILAAGQSTDRLVRAAEAMDREFIAQNLSPGGCADMLAISLFLFFLFDR